MAITSYNAVRIGQITTVTVTSDLEGTIYYHWFVDGVHVGATTSPQYTLLVEAGGQVRIEAIDTNDAAYDWVANAPAGWPARKLLWWIRSLDSDVASYRVEQNRDAAGWTELVTIDHDEDQWSYQHLTDRLDDLIAYQWRVLPIDAAGNAGTPLSLGSETVVRTPDAPAFTITFDQGTTTVTFAAAA